MTESASSKDQRPYERFTLKMAVELAAPHTWPASILPVLVATSCAVVHSPALDVFMVCALLAICILMQASVNTFNDYFDFIKGTDTAEDNVEASPRRRFAWQLGYLLPPLRSASTSSIVLDGSRSSLESSAR